MSDQGESSSAPPPFLPTAGFVDRDDGHQLDPKRGITLSQDFALPDGASSSAGPRSASETSNGSSRHHYAPQTGPQGARVPLDVSYGPAQHFDKKKASIKNADAPEIRMTRYRPPARAGSSATDTAVECEAARGPGAVLSVMQVDAADADVAVDTALLLANSASATALDGSAGAADEASASASVPYGPANDYTPPFNKGRHIIEPTFGSNKEDDEGVYDTGSDNSDDEDAEDAEHSGEMSRPKHVPAWKLGDEASKVVGDINHWGYNGKPFTAIEPPVQRMVRIKRRKYQGPPGVVDIGKIQGMGRHCRYVVPKDVWDAVDLSSSPQFKHLVAVSSTDVDDVAAQRGEILLYPLSTDGTVDKSGEPLRLPPGSELVEVPFQRHELEWRGPLTGYEVPVCNADMSKPASMRLTVGILGQILDEYAEDLCAEALPCVPIMPADMDLGTLDNERLTSNEVHAYKTAVVRRKRFDLGRLCRAWWNGASKEWEDVVIVGVIDGERAAKNVRAWIPNRYTGKLRLTLQMPLVNMWHVLRSLAGTRRDLEEPMPLAQLTLLHSFEPEKFPRNQKDFDLATWNTTLDQFDVKSLVYEPYSGDRIIEVRSLDVVARALRRPWPLRYQTTWSMNLDPAVEMAALNAPTEGITREYVQESLEEAEESRAERKAEQDRIQTARRLKDDPEVIKALPKKERKALARMNHGDLTARERIDVWGTYYDATRHGGRERIHQEASASLRDRQERLRSEHEPECRSINRSGQLPMREEYRKRMDRYVPRDEGPPLLSFPGRPIELGFNPPVPYGFFGFLPGSWGAVKAAALTAVPMLKPSKAALAATPFSPDGCDRDDMPSRENYDRSRDWEGKSEYRQWSDGRERWEEGQALWRRRLGVHVAQQPRAYSFEQYKRDKRAQTYRLEKYERVQAERQAEAEMKKEGADKGGAQDRAVKRARYGDVPQGHETAAPTLDEPQRGVGAVIKVERVAVGGGVDEEEAAMNGAPASASVTTVEPTSIALLPAKDSAEETAMNVVSASLVGPASIGLSLGEDPEEAAMNGALAARAPIKPVSIASAVKENPEEAATNGPSSLIQTPVTRRPANQKPAKVVAVVVPPGAEYNEEAAMNDATRKPAAQPAAAGPSKKRKADDERCAVSPQKSRVGRPPQPSASENVVQALSNKRKREDSPPPAAPFGGIVKPEPKRQREQSPPRAFATGGVVKSESKPVVKKQLPSDDSKLRHAAAPAEAGPIEVPKPQHPGHTYMDLAYESCDKLSRAFKKHAPRQVTSGVAVELPLAQPVSDRTIKRRKRAVEREAVAAAEKQAEEAQKQIVGHAFAHEQRPPRLPWPSLNHLDEEERGKREIWADLFGIENGEYKRFDESTKTWLALKHQRKQPKAWRLPQGWVPQNPLANQLLHHMLLIWVESLTELTLRAPWMDLFRDIRRCSKRGNLVEFNYHFVPLNAKAAHKQLTRTQQRKKHASPNPPVGSLKSLDNILMWDFKHRPDKWYRTMMRQRARASGGEAWTEPEARRTLFWQVHVPYDMWVQQKDRRRFKGLGRDSPFEADPDEVHGAVTDFLSKEVRCKFNPPEEAETADWSDQRYFAEVKEFLQAKKRVRTQVGEITLGLGKRGKRLHKFSGRNLAQITGYEYMDEKWVARHVRAWKAEYENRAALMILREERLLNDPEWRLRRDRTVDVMIGHWVRGWDDVERIEMMRSLRKRYGAKKLYEACNWWLRHCKYPGVKVGVEWKRA